MDHLPKGLYEQVISAELWDALQRLSPTAVTFQLSALDPSDSYRELSRYVAEVVERVLKSLPESNRIERQVEVCNAVLTMLRDAHGNTVASTEVIRPPAESLLAIIDATPTLAGDVPTAVRPHVPLATSDLLVNARGEPAVGHALEREIPSADRIDLICAFIRWNGLRLLLPQLRAHSAMGRSLRVITTTYTGSTERRALDELVKLG